MCVLYIFVDYSEVNQCHFCQSGARKISFLAKYFFSATYAGSTKMRFVVFSITFFWLKSTNLVYAEIYWCNYNCSSKKSNRKADQRSKNFALLDAWQVLPRRIKSNVTQRFCIRACGIGCITLSNSVEAEWGVSSKRKIIK